ncbi:hypothetical protein KCP77_22710 [Salmonella enterica subsp. enterica]|nr:hypothetical protein KCP77_22710 [Salmonella enterica subsp. enterica]
MASSSIRLLAAKSGVDASRVITRFVRQHHFLASKELLRYAALSAATGVIWHDRFAEKSLQMPVELPEFWRDWWSQDNTGA